MVTLSRENTDRIILVTKGWVSTSPVANDAGLFRLYLYRTLEDSLKRLGVETIDFHQLHASDMDTPVEILLFLGYVVRAGKISYIGLSNFIGWQLQLTVSTAKERGFSRSYPSTTIQFVIPLK